MSFEMIGLLIIGAVILGIGFLAIASLRKRSEDLEGIAWGEASKYRQEKNNAR